MRPFELVRCPLSIGALGALLSACGGGATFPNAAGNAFIDATKSKHHQTFSYTGAAQTFIVPAGVTRLSVIARGGEGIGYLSRHGSGTPGFPGRVYAVIRVHPGDKLYVFVAGAGNDGGFNGGGSDRTGRDGFGGGASDVRVGGDALKNRIVVAAGGGSAGQCVLNCYAGGGDGGGLNGQHGYSGFGGGGINGDGGAGGTQSAGGLGGAGGIGHFKRDDGRPGGSGALGRGGNGGKGGLPEGVGHIPGLAGGGGGGGYYGGGGGGGSASPRGGRLDWGSGGGGGGSSYVEPNAITSRMWTGWRGTTQADGQIIFSWK